MPKNNFEKANKLILSSCVDFYVQNELIATLGRNKLLLKDSNEYQNIYKQYTDTLIKHDQIIAVDLTKVKKILKIINIENMRSI